LPEPVISQGRLRVRVERPYVPAVARRPFVVAGLSVLSSWSIAGLFFSIGPQLGVVVFHTSDVVVAAIGVFALLATAALAQLVLGRATPWVGATVGSGALALGMIVIVNATAAASGAGYLAGSIATGFGFGIAFLGGLRGLVRRSRRRTGQASCRRSPSSPVHRCQYRPSLLACSSDGSSFR
jgi:hypothetical protein